jgi:hypothetical protein
MHFFEIQYETPPGLPPPYCYYFHLVGRVVQGAPQVTFDWVYTHREDLSEEEITAEGFTGDDDYHWQGALHEAWLLQLEKNVAKTQAVAHPDEEGTYLHVTAEAVQRVLFRGHPRNLTEWEYFLQELVQAIYETAGKEARCTCASRKVTPGAPLPKQRWKSVSATARYSVRAGQDGHLPPLGRNAGGVAVHLRLAVRRRSGPAEGTGGTGLLP